MPNEEEQWRKGVDTKEKELGVLRVLACGIDDGFINVFV